MQKGIAAVLILIVIAVIIGLSAILYGYFVVIKPTTKVQPSPSPIAQITTENMEAVKQLGTPECPDTDYTGCDTSSKWMTWSEKDLINPENLPE